MFLQIKKRVSLPPISHSLFPSACESAEEKRGLIDDLLFQKVDSGRAQEGESLEMALNKRQADTGNEFQRLEGKEVMNVFVDAT